MKDRSKEISNLVGRLSRNLSPVSTCNSWLTFCDFSNSQDLLGGNVHGSEPFEYAGFLRVWNRFGISRLVVKYFCVQTQKIITLGCGASEELFVKGHQKGCWFIFVGILNGFMEGKCYGLCINYIVPRDPRDLLRMLMEPKFYAFLRWLFTPIIL